MGVASGCGEQEVGVASGSGWNLWVWLLSVVVRRYMYIDFLILLIPTFLLFVHFFKCFSFFIYIYQEDFAQQYRNYVSITYFYKIFLWETKHFLQDYVCLFACLMLAMLQFKKL